MYSSQVSRFAFSDKIRNEVGIIAIQRLFWEGGITARREPLNQTMVVGPLVGPFKTLLSILKGFNGIYIFYNRRYKITFTLGGVKATMIPAFTETISDIEKPFL